MHARGAALAAVGLLALGAAPGGAKAGTGLIPATKHALAAAFKPSSGRPRLIHLWGSWCVPCMAEWPRLAEAMREWSLRPIDIVTVALEEDATGEAAERALGELGGVPGESLRASFEDAIPVIKSLDPDWDGSIPTTFLLEAAGRVAVAQRGVTRLRALEAEIERVLPSHEPRKGRTGASP